MTEGFFNTQREYEELEVKMLEGLGLFSNPPRRYGRLWHRRKEDGEHEPAFTIYYGYGSDTLKDLAPKARGRVLAVAIRFSDKKILGYRFNGGEIAAAEVAEKKRKKKKGGKLNPLGRFLREATSTGTARFLRREDPLVMKTKRLRVAPGGFPETVPSRLSA